MRSCTALAMRSGDRAYVVFVQRRWRLGKCAPTFLALIRAKTAIAGVLLRVTWKAYELHLGALRALRNPAVASDSLVAAEVLEGLANVSKRYANAPPRQHADG